MKALALAGMLLLPLVDASAACYDTLKKKLPDSGVIIFGELHGTVETPAFFLKCAREFIDKGEDVHFAIEFSATHNPLFGRYIAGQADEAEMLATGHWKFTDGRSSKAMLQLYRDLRELKKTRPDMAFFGFDDKEEDVRTAGTRDQRMARNFVAAYSQKAYTFVFTGNAHAQLSVGAPWDPRFAPFAMFLNQNGEPGCPLRRGRRVDLHARMRRQDRR